MFENPIAEIVALADPAVLSKTLEQWRERIEKIHAIALRLRPTGSTTFVPSSSANQAIDRIRAIVSARPKNFETALGGYRDVLALTAELRKSAATASQPEVKKSPPSPAALASSGIVIPAAPPTDESLLRAYEMLETREQGREFLAAHRDALIRAYKARERKARAAETSRAAAFTAKVLAESEAERKQAAQRAFHDAITG